MVCPLKNNVCLNRRAHKTSPALPARKLPRVRLNDEMDSSRVFLGIAMCQHSGVNR